MSTNDCIWLVPESPFVTISLNWFKHTKLWIKAFGLALYKSCNNRLNSLVCHVYDNNLFQMVILELAILLTRRSLHIVHTIYICSQCIFENKCFCACIVKSVCNSFVLLQQHVCLVNFNISMPSSTMSWWFLGLKRAWNR